MSERNAFGPSLKAERDRRGVTLQAIADSTKISISLLAALERNDMSRWPSGIFRRAFVREYVTALGLPPEPLVAEFVRLFPDGSVVDPTHPPGPCPAAPEITELRLTLEPEPSAMWRMLRTRAFVALVEACVVIGVGSTSAWVLGAPAWSGVGMLALVYYPLASIFLERAPRPRLPFTPAGPSHWLRATSKSVTRVWSRPAVRNPEAEGMDSSTPAAPEWHTASN